MNTKENNGFKNLNDLFKNEIKEPFHYNLNLECANNEIMFENIKQIFLTGLVIHVGDEKNKNINLDEVTLEDVDKISKYMLSIGLKVNYKKIDSEEKDSIFRRFLYDIENLEDLDIQVTLDWKTNFVNTLKLTVLSNNQTTLNKIHELSKKHSEANIFLKLFPPSILKDYAIFLNRPNNETYLFYFDFAIPGDYITYSGCKPKTGNGQSWQN